MTDPFADVRSAKTQVESWAVSEPSSGRFISMNHLDDWLEQFEKVLTDADALLAVVRAAQEYTSPGRDTATNWAALKESIAALPEHLR